MKNQIIALLIGALTVMPVAALAAQPTNPGPWKTVGKKYVYYQSDFGTCIMMNTGDGGVEYWWLFSNPYTFTDANQVWTASGNPLLETTGTRLHTVGKLQSSMTLEEAVTRGFDATWDQYYVKYNWME